MDRLLLLTAEESRVNMEDVKLLTIETVSNQFYKPSERKAVEEGKEQSTGDAGLATESSEKPSALSPSGESEAMNASAVDSQTESEVVQQREGTMAKDEAPEVGEGGGNQEGGSAPAVSSPTGSCSKDEEKPKSNDDSLNDGVPQKDKEATSNEKEERQNTKTSAAIASGALSTSHSGTSKTAVITQASPSPETVELTENLKQSQAQVSALLVAAKGTAQPQTYVVPVPMVTHVPVVKSGLKPSINIQKEREKIAIMSAEKLMVGQVEMLSGHEPKPVEICSAVQETMDRGAIASARTPQVAVISPMLSRETMEGKSGSTGGSVKKQADVTVIDLSQDEEGGGKSSTRVEEVLVQGGNVAGVRMVPQFVGRKILMSSGRPLDPASLEHIGVDSKGNMLWYDGGRNMFQSPPTVDSSHKPSESELTLVCKSMVQWMAKLKELRGSSSETDNKVAQTIREHFISRVRIATQRKPKDPATVQKLIATASAHMKHPQFPIATLPMTATTSSENNPAASSPVSVVAAKGTQMVQPTFPQGSILVMPHPQHPFHALLPVFANTAVIMPPNAAATAQKTVETRASSEIATTASKSEAGKTPMHVAAPSIVQAISGTSNTNAEKTFEAGRNSKQSSERGQSKGVTIATPAGPATIPAMHAFTFAGFPTPHAFALPVTDPVELATIDFNSKSVEITGEVPIKKIELKPEEIEAAKMAAATMALESSTSESNKPEVDDSTKTGEGTEVNAPQDKEHAGKDGGSEPLGQVSTTPGMIHGSHTSTEVMSAKMLLSLKGKDWQVSPLDKDAPQVIAASDSSLSLPQSAPQTPSSGRKRKQKPIASVKISDVAISPDGAGILPQIAAGDKDAVAVDDSTAPAKKKRGRKPKQVAGVGGSDEPVTSTPKGRGRKKHAKGEEEKGTLNALTGQELLAILDIPPSVESKSPTPAKAKGRSKELLDTDKGVPHGTKGSAKLQLQQLKASGASKPMKEYVIETDSESGNDSDSSSTGSSSFTPSSSSSDSSSNNSSSEAAPAEEKPPQSSRGRGRGRSAVEKVSQQDQSSSSEESSSEDNEEKGGVKEVETQRRRGRGRGRRGVGRGRPRGQHIVRIPTNLLLTQPQVGMKRKARSSQAESDDPEAARKANELASDVPVDLASLYASGGVDLGTLSELTRSVRETAGVNAEDGTQVRSKRKCVIVREEISKLQEILGEVGTIESKSSSGVVKPRGRGRGRPPSAGRTSDTGYQEPSPSVRKYRRPAYSQFTHKRRKRRKRQPEEEALWQPARKQAPGESLKPLYVFSTNLANKAAEAVLRGKYDSIIQFHQAQPKGPGFLRLPQPKSQGESSAAKDGDTAESGKESGSRPPKRRSSRPSTDDSPMVKKLRGGGRNRSDSQTTEDSKSSAPSRYSRRLRKQRGDSVPSSPSSPASQKSPSPSPSNQRSTRSRPSALRSEVTLQRSTRNRRISLQESQQKSSSPPPPPSATSHEEEELDNSQQTVDEDSALSAADEQERTSTTSKGLEDQQKSLRGNQRDDSQESPLIPSPHESDTSVPPVSQDEINYTICHGTPIEKSSANDISSPKTWEQQQRQAQQFPYPQQLQRQQMSHSGHSPLTQASGESAFSPCADPVSTPQYTAGNAHPHHLLAREQAMGHPHNMQLTEQQLHKETNNWNAAGLTPQFPGYVPSMYNPGLAPMYPPHAAAQPMAAPNYPYPLPYPWGHHAHHLGSHGDHIMQQHHHRSAKSLHEQPGAQGVDLLHQQDSRSMDMVQQLSHSPQVSMMQGLPSSVASVSSRLSDINKEPSSFSPDHTASSSSLPKPPTMEKIPITATSASLPPPPTLHQFPTHGSSHHQVQHAFSRPPHALTPEHIPHGAPTHPHAAAAFPYGFEPNPLSTMHMWQQTQMQPTAMRSIPGMHPSHLQPHLAPHGLWYHHQAMAPLMPGLGEIPGGASGDHSKLGKKSSKGTGKSSQVDVGGGQAKLNRNSNNSNNNESPGHAPQGTHSNAQMLYTAQYQAQAFIPRLSSFSVEDLTGSSPSNLREDIHASRVARGSTWVPPTVGTETQADIHSRLVASMMAPQTTPMSPTHDASSHHLTPHHSHTTQSSTTHRKHPLPEDGRSLLMRGHHRHASHTDGMFEEQEDLPTSAILERTRRSSEFTDMDSDCIINPFPS